MSTPFLNHHLMTSIHKISDRLGAEPVRNFVCRGREDMRKRNSHERNDEETQQTQSSKLFSDERIDPLLSQVQSKDAESLLGETGLAGQLKKRLAERRLEAELNPPLWLNRACKEKRVTIVMAAARRP